MLAWRLQRHMRTAFVVPKADCALADCRWVGRGAGVGVVDKARLACLFVVPKAGCALADCRWVMQGCWGGSLWQLEALNNNTVCKVSMCSHAFGGSKADCALADCRWVMQGCWGACRSI